MSSKDSGRENSQQEKIRNERRGEEEKSIEQGWKGMGKEKTKRKGHKWRKEKKGEERRKIKSIDQNTIHCAVQYS